MNSIIYKISNTREDLPKIPDIVESASISLGISEELGFKLQLCLDEVLTNTITYGYPDGNTDKIIIEFIHSENTVLLKISDNAIEFNPLSVDEPDISLSLDDREIGGLGIHFVRKFSKSQKYSRINDKNILEIEFEK
jgi:anti-sigma regulatory factor (Ser/Thr protein kinase)